MAATGHVAVFPFPFTSHVGSALLITRKMAAAAADVRFTFFVTEKAAKANGVAIGTSDGNIDFRRVDDGDAGGKARDLAEQVEMFMREAGGSFRSCMEAAEKEVGRKVSCVVSDAFLSMVVPEVVEAVAAKWVAFWTAGTTALASFMYIDTLRSTFGKGGIGDEGKTMDRHISGFPAVYPSELPAGLTSLDLSSGMGLLFHTMALKLSKADAIAINSCRTLENSIIANLNRAKFDDKLLCLGPFSFTMLSSSVGVDEDKHGCLPWLEAQLTSSGPSTVAYISFGTFTSPSTEELASLAKTLKHMEVSFLWALPQAYHTSLPENFYDWAASSGKGMIIPWAPQTMVLQHKAVGAHVTHCGWNSVMESIFAQVPMVCRPFPFADQMLHKGLVERVWGIGVGVEGGELTDAATAKAIQTVLLGEEGRKMREKIKEMKRLIEKETNGSSATDIQRLIDVVRSE